MFIGTHRDLINDLGKDRLCRRVKWRRCRDATLDENDGMKNFPFV